MKKIFFYFLASFDNFSKGASASRISACAGICSSIYITKRFTNPQNIVYVLIIWLLFSLLCLGIILFRQITELVNSYKNGNDGKVHLEEKQTLDEALKSTIDNSKDINEPKPQ